MVSQQKNTAQDAARRAGGLMDAGPRLRREAAAPTAGAPQAPSGWPRAEPGSPPLPRWLPWAGAVLAVLLLAAAVALALQAGSTERRIAALEDRAAALAAELEEARAGEAAALARGNELRTQMEELRRQVETLMARPAAPAAPPSPAAPRPAPPRGTTGR